MSKSKLSSDIHTMADSIESMKMWPFSRYTVTVGNGDKLNIVGYGIIYPNFKSCLYITESDTTILYANLETLFKDFNNNHGFEFTFLDHDVLNKFKSEIKDGNIN